MEESKELKKLYLFLQSAIYFFLVIEFIAFLPIEINVVKSLQIKLSKLIVYENLIYSKVFCFLLVCTVSLGTKAKKDVDFNPKKQIVIPLIIGFIITICSVFAYMYEIKDVLFGLKMNHIIYMILSLIGIIFLHISFDNISKIIKSNFMKDRFNLENESFEQPKIIESNSSSVNIPMLFYYKKKIHKGWLNITNVFRGTMVIGTPGSGKSFGIIIPFMKQLIKKNFTMLIYDYKYPDLTEIAYYRFQLQKKENPKLKFHVINLSDVEHSRRINPLHPKYLRTKNDSAETAETLIRSLSKSSGSKGGSEQFFTQSAINFLTAVMYFFSQYENGKYCTFPHILNFLSKGYKEMFDVLFSNDELEEVLAVFKTAYDNETFQMLDGQIGTVRVNLSNLGSKELAWIFSGDDVELKISDKENPSILILANNEANQSINSSANALIINRIIKEINTEGNLPSAIIVDESPTVYIHKIDNLVSTARSKKVAVLLGLQELPQLVAGYGKENADKISSVIGNIISGSVRKKETLNWLQQLFGKVKQQRESLSINKNTTSVSLSEQMDFLIPESKISNLNQGEVVAQIVNEKKDFDGTYKSGSYNCKINLDIPKIEAEKKLYKKPNKYYSFPSVEAKEEILRENYKKIKSEVNEIVIRYAKPD